MAKCPVCNAKKGKRKCSIKDDFICSLCCGEIRKEEACSGCSFFQKPTRKYNKVPAYTVSEMDGNEELESYGNSIEGALCAYDVENNDSLKDSDAIRIIELLVDKYHFMDDKINEEDQFVINGFHFVNNSISEDLSDLSNEILVKILGVIRFVAKRRTKTGREYMKIIHQYVGQRVAPGIRLFGQ